MTTDLKPYTFENKQVRAMCDLNEDLWFVAADVCRVLELEHTGSATRILDPDEKGVQVLHTHGGDQEMTIISEPGLYKLIARSHKPEAKRFDRWVRHEVLPTIRRTGGYGAPDASQIGGIVKAILTKQLADVHAEMQRMQARMNALIIEHDPRVSAVEFRPMLAILVDQKVPQRKRRALSSRCSSMLRRYCAERSIPIRISPETGRYLFHVDAARDWMHIAGQQVIAKHIAAVTGQTVMKFPKPI